MRSPGNDGLAGSGPSAGWLCPKRDAAEKEGVPALGCAGRRPVPPRSLARAAFRDMCRLAGAAKGRGELLL